MAEKDYSKLASIIIENVGGKENIAGLIHCITRLRFTLRNEDLAKDEVLKETDGIIDVIHAAGQYQVVIGNAVTKVFDAVMEELEDELKENDQSVQRSEAQNQFVKLFGNLIGFVTGAMSPVIGVIAASGITKGMLVLLTLPQLGALLDAKGTTYATISAIADSAFTFCRFWWESVLPSASAETSSLQRSSAACWHIRRLSSGAEALKGCFRSGHWIFNS